MFNLFYKNNSLQNSLAATLAISLLFSAGVWAFFLPKPAQAVPADTIGGPSQVEQTIWEKIKWGFQKAYQAADTALQKVQTAIDGWSKSNEIFKQAAAAAAEIALHTILRMLTNEIIAWIQGEGDPRFVGDWQSFLKEAGDKVGGLFVKTYLGGGWLCEPFDLNVKIALLDVPTFDTRVKCTLSDIVENIEGFYEDFSQGGWRGWIELTKPQNNFYGAYYMAREEKLTLEAAAKEAAGQEAIAGRGFLSVKVCARGHVISGGGQPALTCNSKESCDALKGQSGFVCDKEVATTPASVISDVVGRAIDRELDLLAMQIADLTDAKGILAPYIIAIGNALVNRMITEGLSFIAEGGESGPTISNPNKPLPSGTPVVSIDKTPEQATQNQASATMLVEQQKLLKENLETQLLPQQQSNLNVMQSIQTTQTSILTTLKNILAQECSLPSWASSQIISSEDTTQTIQITAADIGTALVKKTGASYQLEETTPQITNQITALEEDIIETNQWIADTATAINSTNGYNQAVDDYLNLYQRTLQPPTQQEQAALDQQKQLMETAKNLAVTDGQKAGRSSTTSLEQLDTDTQNTAIQVNQTINNLLQARGISQDFPQDGTLYAQKQDLQTKLSQARSDLSSCD